MCSSRTNSSSYIACLESVPVASTHASTDQRPARTQGISVFPYPITDAITHAPCIRLIVSIESLLFEKADGVRMMMKNATMGLKSPMYHGTISMVQSTMGNVMSRPSQLSTPLSTHYVDSKYLSPDTVSYWSKS